MIDKVIYLYLFICVALLFFNLIYILRSGHKKKRSLIKSDYWKKEIGNATSCIREYHKIPESHRKLIRKRLRKIEELTAYQSVLFSEEVGMTAEEKEIYFTDCRPVFSRLALIYGRRNAMERAFFAYVVSGFCRYGENITDQMPSILLSYLKDSTVYCRENVLQALYSLGNPGAVEQAFDYISKNEWYHHARLISDGLQNFRGDKEKLVWRLWKHRKEWEEVLVVGVVQFAGTVSGIFQEVFLEAMCDTEIAAEIRFALMRYFRRYPCKRAREYFINLLMNGEEEAAEFSIVAASVLEVYPGEDTKTALKKAMCNRNWYVRRNAAMSLKHIGITWQDEQEIQSSEDRYACEMLSYVTGKKEAVSA